MELRGPQGLAFEVEAARERIAALPCPAHDPGGGEGIPGWGSG